MEWAQSGFAERLEEALKQRGLTQIKLCTDHNFNRGTLSGWKDKSEPSYADMVRLAAALEVRPGWLYFNDTFEAADDEEKALLEVWRKMTEAERIGFMNTFKAIADARPATKKPGKRTKTSSPGAAPAPRPPQSEPHVKMPLNAAELELVQTFLVSQAETGMTENPLLAPLRKLTSLLAGLYVAQKSSERAVVVFADEETGEVNAPSDATL